MGESFRGFEARAFEAFEARKWASNVYNVERMAVRDQLRALGQALALRELTLENQWLGDQARRANGTMSAQELELLRLEAEEPGITHVVWDADGSVLMDTAAHGPHAKS